MKKHYFFWVALVVLSQLPVSVFAQSTEGVDFWVTLMRGDTRNYDELSLTFSAKKATMVYIENTYTGYTDSVYVGDNSIERLILNSQESSCYVTDADAERPSNHALHVTSKEPISLIAANYKEKSFDVAAILPTTALLSEYRIQCYSPYAHKDPQQGSHFAIVAADDNVVVDITPTVMTSQGKAAGTTFATDTLRRGQVYYVWTGEGKGDNYDFTGTEVKARNNKKIAVFNGNSHTNIPSIEDRDHIYSQAMPVQYWGRRFAITSSLTTIDDISGYWERIDKIRVQALADSTVVMIDGDTVHVFDFATNPKHYFEFDFGARDSENEGERYQNDGHPYFEGASHYVETSCPSAVHLFMTSNQYDHKKISSNKKLCNGDPSEIWVNPVEQKIKELTFGTFQTNQVKDHFLNIVTTADNVNSVQLDGTSISDQFTALNGNPEYMYARISNLLNGTHTLTSDSGFIAHVYGFGLRESYGYPAGGTTRDLTAYITINGKEFKPGDDNLLCGDDTVDFSCELNYEFDSIYWFFGDGKDSMLTVRDTIHHYYEEPGLYSAYVRIFRPYGESTSDCGIWDNAYDSIAFLVNIGNFKVDVIGQKMPECTKAGDEVDFKIFLSNPAKVALDTAHFTFTPEALADGFDSTMITVQGDTALIIHLPPTARDRVTYGLNLYIGSECPNSVLNTDLEFELKFDIPVLAQRYDNVLGILRDSFLTAQLTDFVWYHDNVVMADETSPILYLDENNTQNSGEYYVCFTIHEEGKADYDYCTCPIRFDTSGKKHMFEPDSTGLTITATYIVEGQKVFVNADWNGNTGIECYAQWITPSGSVYGNEKFDIPDGGCTITTPNENGFYILRVVTDEDQRSFKFIVNK